MYQNRTSQHAPVSDRLRKVRGKMAQDEFAAVLGLTRRQMGAMERGEVAVSVDVCVAVYQQFGVSITWLLLGDGPTYVPGEHLTIEEHELLNLARRAPDALQLIKKIIASSLATQEAVCELTSKVNYSSNDVVTVNQRWSATRKLPSCNIEHAVTA